MRTSVSLLLTCAIAGCSRSAPPPSPSETTAVPPGAVAACAGEAISAAAVSSVASAEGVSREVALERLVEDARLARAARDRGLEDEPRTHAELRAVYARRILDDVKREIASTPATHEELDRIRAAHWVELDRPESVRTVHAVVIVAKDADAAKKASAKAIADAIAAATRGSTSEAEFRDRAAAVPHEGFDVKIETLPPIAPDGRVVDAAGGSMDATFSAAATRLRAPNDEVGPIETPFGFHVIHLLAREPAHRVPDDELAKLAHEEIFANRARAKLQELETSLRAREGVGVARNADDLLHVFDDTNARTARRSAP